MRVRHGEQYLSSKSHVTPSAVAAGLHGDASHGENGGVWCSQCDVCGGGGTCCRKVVWVKELLLELLNDLLVYVVFSKYK